ncbi:amino acid permease [Zopfochytrium polystomum]|nr:amino acid permease [Zopfochytrium polystomum]
MAKHDAVDAVETSSVKDDNGLAADALHRGLKNRHIAMISIGGVIGVGLFLGTANALRTGGPLGMLLGYVVIGTLVFAVTTALGEMAAFLPLPGGHLTLAKRFVDPSLSFALGWNYFYSWAMVLPAELSAAMLLVHYWTTAVNDAVWIAIFLAVVVAINFMSSGVYGEFEFWFASIKVLAVITLIITGIVITAGGGPNHESIGFKYWSNPGPFVEYIGTGTWGQFLGFWAVLILATFSFIGTEIVAVAAGETKNPRKNVAKAISNVYIRICLFYILGVFVIGLLVASDDPDLNIGGSTAASSPFVIGIKRAGIKYLPDIINAAILTSAWSAANSDVYTASRALYSLAAAGNAPKIFMKRTRNGHPYVAVGASACFGLLAFMTTSSGAGKVFNWLSNLTSVSGLFSWLCISIIYLRFHYGMKKQGIDRSKLPYIAPLQPYASWYALVLTLLVIIFSNWTVFTEGRWDTPSFVTNYLPIPVFILLYFGHKFTQGTSVVPLDQLDFVSDVQEIEALEEDESEDKNQSKFQKVLDSLF